MMLRWASLVLVMAAALAAAHNETASVPHNDELEHLAGADSDAAAAAAHHSNVRRYVHRHEHIGVDADSADHIGCAEIHAKQFEHMLTPAALWCDAATCLSEFDVSYPVHSIDCDAARCAVLLHCGAELERIKWASLATLGALLCLIVLPLFGSARAVRSAVVSQRRDASVSGDKRV